MSLALDPSDDLPHAPEPIPGWSENHMVYAVDRAGVSLIAHLGTMPDDPTLWHCVFALVFSDGTVLSGKSIGAAPDRRTAGATGAYFRTIEPFRRWHCVFAGGMQVIDEVTAASKLVPDGQHVSVSIELEFTAAGAVWSAGRDEDQPEFGFFHHEQPLRARGTVKHAGRICAVDAAGYRDHSVGPRDLSKIDRAFWCNGVFESGWAFGTLWSRRMKGDTPTAAFTTASLGFAFENGEVVPATFGEPSLLDDQLGAPTRYRFSLELPSGVRVIEVEVGAGMKYSWVGPSEWALGTDSDDPDGYVVHHHVTTLTCDGEIGSGVSDRGAKIKHLFQQSSRRP